MNHSNGWTSSSFSILPHLNELQETTDPSKSTQNLDSLTTNPKRRRAKSRKNKEEIENQRMTQIAVEGNRRKQMNEYLSVLRSLMPDSYIQRGDQASIIGGAINFVKELEQRLPFLGAQKEGEGKSDAGGEYVGEVKYGIVDIEVTMVESHANLKIRSKKRPKQLLKLVKDDCKLGSFDDIAEAVYQTLDRIQQEAVLNLISYPYKI
ncbi:hypothetical protein VNO80_15316 [Phaseolus coccineus]|uniref:BHLH domain-containing protein n=1 Tax=Phaseolus coccineus TaxID=3886 RepID=A0AAN9MK27_PHACN